MFYYLDTQISLANIVYDLNRSNKDASSRYLDNYELFGDLYTEYMITCRKLYHVNFKTLATAILGTINRGNGLLFIPMTLIVHIRFSSYTL